MEKQQTDKEQWKIPDAYSKRFGSREELASCFLAMTMAFFNINIRPKELEYLSFLILRENGIVGQLTNQLYREKYKTSKQFVHNMISSLKKKSVIIKDEKDGKTKLHPKLAIKITDDNFQFRYICRKKTGDTL